MIWSLPLKTVPRALGNDDYHPVGVQHHYCVEPIASTPDIRVRFAVEQNL